MTVDEFNEKYKDYLEKGHYGLAVSDSDFINWLDERFQEFIKVPRFQFSQIKAKFGRGVFYADNLDIKDISEVENKITQLCETI